jgi:hypothetical protein
MTSEFGAGRAIPPSPGRGTDPMDSGGLRRSNRPGDSTMRRRPWTVWALLVLLTGSGGPLLGQAGPDDSLRPYGGPSLPGVDPKTLTGKIMCGYQGWFSAPGDGGERGWNHWAKDRSKPLGPGNAKIDLWPDVSELTPEERFPTAFTLADGRNAEVFSSFRAPTVLRHFRWMREYGIDGAFVQRFICDLKDPREARHNNAVLSACREGANRSGRAYAVMYDLTGLRANRIADVMDDWRALRSRMRVTEDPAYLHHHGKPVVAVWGVGFGDRREYTIPDCLRLVEFLKGDREAGGCTVVLGVPSGWRESKMDASPDPALLEVIRRGDVVCPWTVGRYDTPEEVAKHAEKLWKPDLAWCRASERDYLPVVFPGFSWHNMHAGPLDQIPRLKGRFLWSQLVALKRAGATMVYVAMFDEVDEATAIFKCANLVPTAGGAAFVTYEGLPGDFYLKLAGSGARLLRGEIPASDEMPR